MDVCLLPFPRYWRLKLENGLFPPTNPLFDAPARGGAPEFMDETYPTKLETWGYTVR